RRTGELHERPESLAGRTLLVLLEPDELRVEPVAGRAPLVLLDERPGLGCDLAVPLVSIRERRHETLAEGDEPRDVRKPRLRVADPHLDRAECRVRPQVPPDVRVVRERVGLDTALDEELELLPGRERRRHPAPGEWIENLDSGRRKARVTAVPEGRVGRK